MRIAHLSDFHFAKPDMDPSQLLSKRWLGNLNTLIKRKKTFCNKRPFELIPFLQELKVEMCLITGDFTSTSSDTEFVLAKEFTDRLDELRMPWFGIPGNHDCYTSQAMSEHTYYRTFPDQFKTSSFRLSKDKLTDGPLCDGWWLIALDTTIATSILSSEGLFPEELDPLLETALKRVPDNQKILMMNHFPFSEHEHPRRRMRRGPDLQAILEKSHQVQLYLHGHTHRLCLADLRPSHLPIVLDSGSAAHNMLSSFNVLDLSPSACDIEVYHWNKTGWHSIQKEQFTWPSGTTKA